MALFDYLEEKRRQAIRRRQLKSMSKIVTGAALGAIGGILFAPQEGKKTREDIANKSRDIADNVVDVAKDTADTLQFKAYQASEQVKKTYADLKDKACDKKEELDENIAIAKAKGKAIGEVVKEGAKDIKEDAKSTKEEVKDTAKDVKKDLKEGAKDVKEDAKKSAEEIKKDVDRTKDKIDHHAKR